MVAVAAFALLLIPGLAFADVPVATISGPELVAEGVDATTDRAVEYTVSLAGQLRGSADIVIDYTVTGTATNDVDYTDPGNGKLTIGDTDNDGIGDASATIAINVKHDDVDEVGETLIVTLTGATTSAGTAAIGSPNQVTTTIRASDTVIVTATGPPVAENNTDGELEFEVTVPIAPAGVTGSVKIAYATRDVTATAGADYTAQSGTLTLALGASANTGTVTVAIEDDSLYEGDEQFELTLRLVDPPANVALENSVLTGTIEDDDALTVGVAAQETTVAEGSAATFLVSLTAGSPAAPASGSSAVVVEYEVEGTGITEEDYEDPAAGTLTIPAEETTGTITITTLVDELLEDDETLTVTLKRATTVAGMVTVPDGGAETATTTIGDRGRKVTVEVLDATGPEDGNAVFDVRLSGTVSGNVELTYATTDGTATTADDDDDYTSASAVAFTIEAGQTSGRITVALAADDIAEGEESFTLTASGTLSGGVAFRRATARGTITDENILKASIKGPDTVDEGSPAVYTVELGDGVGTADVVVDYTVGGTATDGTDYTDVGAGKLTIAADETTGRTAATGSFTIQTRAVANDPAGETLVVTLTKADTANGTAIVGTPDAVTTTYTPEDTVTVSVSANQRTVDEGAPATFDVELTGGTNSQQIVINYVLGGTATAADYTVEPAVRSLTFPAGTTEQTITLTTTDDPLTEAKETVIVTVSLAGQPAGVSIGTPVAVTVINDSDPLTATVGNGPTSVVEGADATFTVTLAGGTSTADVMVPYKVTVDGAVTDDVEESSGVLTIPAGTPTGVITVSVVDDELSESEETLEVTLSKPTTRYGSVALGAASTASTTIQESDGALLVSVSGGGTVNEGADAVFTVELSGTVNQDITVTVTPDADVQDNSSVDPEDNDYVDTAGDVTLEAGELSATFTVATKLDTIAENDETFEVTITENVTNVDIGVATAAATIRDDDPLRVSLSGDKTVIEGSSADYTLEVAGGRASAAIEATWRAGSASGTETISAGAPSASFTVGTQSGDAGGSLSVSLVSVSPTAGRVSRGTSSASTRIVDSNAVTVTLSATDRDVAESADVVFTVSKSGSGDVVVSYATATGTASSADFESTSGTLTLTDTTTSMDVTVNVENDTLAEDDETFSMRLTAVRGGSVVTDRVTAIIEDDDDLTATVTRQQETVLEGTDATFLVALTRTGGARASGSRPVIVGYRATAASQAEAPADYTSPSGKLTIPVGRSSGTITISTKTDDVLELAGETLAVELTPATTTAAGMVTALTTASDPTTIRDHDGTVVVSIANAAPVDEGGAAMFPVRLSGTASQDVTVTVAATENTADYVALPSPATLTIAAGETSGSVTVQTVDDTFVEDDETFTLTLSNLQIGTLGAGSVVLGASTATGTIRKSDPLRVNLSGPRAVVTPATSVPYTLELIGGTTDAGNAVTVDYAFRVGSDSGTGIATVPAESQTVTFNVTPTGPSAGETLVVTLTDVEAVRGTVTRGTLSASTSIVDTTISVANDQTATEAGSLTFSVTPSQPVYAVVSYRTGGGNASSSADYTLQSGTLTFGEITGSTTGVSGTAQDVTVATLPDTLNEANETFTLQLSLVRGQAGVRIGTLPVKGTITDDDPITASVASSQTTVPEGSAATFVVTLAGGTSTAPVVVNYDVGGTAMAEDGDYTAPSGKLTISRGASTGTISIATLDDGVLDRDETLTVTLPVDASTATSAGTVNIDNANNSASTTIGDASDGVSVNIKDTTVEEAETAMFTVELTGKVGADVTVGYSTADGTALTGQTPDPDYTAVSGASLTVEAGETTATIMVETGDDNLAEADETFTVTLTLSGQPPGVDLGDFRATATIEDDGLAARLRGPRTSVDEGEAAVYTFTLPFSYDEVVNVDFSTEGSTATAGEDYSPASGSVTIAAGSRSASFTIQVLPDAIVDLRETLVVTATAETAGGVAVKTQGEWRNTIDDDGTVQVSVMADPEIVPESRGEATFTVTLSGTDAEELTLPWSTGASGDTATADQDYTAVSNATLTIAPRQTEATITVAVTDDDQDEDDETFTVRLDPSAPASQVEIATATAQVRITDHALEASVSAPATVVEGQAVTFTVSLTGGENRSGVTVDWDLGGTAVAPSDYAGPSSGTLTIPQGQDSGTITITTEADGVLDPGETLSVTLSNPRVVGAGLAALGSSTTATVTIVDQQRVTWSVADVAIDENQDAVFTVTLDGLVQDAVTLTYATADGTATAGSDYTAVSNGRVTVAGGSTSATFTVEVIDDSNGEASETFTVRLTRSTTAPAGFEPQSATATATIRDDDLKLLPIAPVTVTEGGQADILVRLERALPEQVMIGYSTAGSATAGMDYTLSVPVIGELPLPQGAIPVPPGESQGVVTVAALDDSLAEGDEQIVVTLTTAPTDGSAPVPLGQAMVTIEDNDELSVSVTAQKTVAEGDAAEFTVRVGGGESTAPVNVSYSLGGTAKAPADYTALSPTMVVVPAGQQTAKFEIRTKADKVLEPDETLVVTLTGAETANGVARVGSPKSATTTIQDPVYHSINRVNEALLPGITRASAAGALEAVSARMALAAQGHPPAATADLAGLTGLYRALLANERAVQDGSYDLAQVLGGSSFLVPLSGHDGAAGNGGAAGDIGGAVWGGGDFRQIGGGDEDADDVDWSGSVWSARLGADMRFIESLLTGLMVSWTSGGLDYTDELAPTDREGTYATWLIGAYPYVGWSTTDFGLWATGGFGFGGVSIDDADEAYEAQEADLTQWSLGAGASVTLLSTDGFIAGGVTDLKLKADGFLGGASVAENEAKTITKLDVGVNQARAAVEASHAQFFADGGSLKPSLEVGGRFDGGDGETGAGLEVGAGVAYADPGSGLTVAAGGRALMLRENYGDWGLSALIQLDPNSAGHGLSMSVRPTIGVAASGVNGLWEHGTLDLLSGSQPGGRVEAEIGYGLPAFGMNGVLTPYAGAAFTDAGAYSLSVGGRLELGPAFGLILEAERSEGADPSAAPEHDVTLEGSFRW